MSPYAGPESPHRRFPTLAYWGIGVLIVAVAIAIVVYRGMHRGEPSARHLAEMTGNETAVDVEDYVGTATGDGARDVAEAFAHPETVLGKQVKVRAEVSEVVSPHLFTLVHDELAEGEDVPVFDEAGMPEGREVDAGDDIVVAGKVVKIDQSHLQVLRQDGLTDLQAAPYLGKLAIVVPAGAPVDTAH